MANSESPILLIGETGTGKELFAHAVHRRLPPGGRAVSWPSTCAAFPENLLESELFGYEEGAFTGAKKGGRPGLFELAHRGTLFLDEVEGMSPALQIKLLRALQEREVMRVGRQPHHPCGRAHRGRHQRGAGTEGAGGHLPPGPLLPVEHPAGGHPAPDGSGGTICSC